MAEFSIITDYFQSLTTQSVEVGIGDDCAVFTPPPHKQLVSCVDTLVAGRHFPLGTAPHAIGWKSVAVNLSDLAAMGATPHSILLALSLPDVNEQWLSEFSRGIADCCSTYGVQLIGGDTTQSPTLTISITALGWITPHTAILRSGAKAGDLIVVSGSIGSAAYALHHPNSRLQDNLDYPKPCLELGQALCGYASSMIDISDGLAQDLGHLLHANQVGAKLQLDQIPIADELKHLDLESRINFILAGGDDYQLCFTISTEQLVHFQQKYDANMYIIGQIQAEMSCIYYNYDQVIHPQSLGYQHFVTSSNTSKKYDNS